MENYRVASRHFLKIIMSAANSVIFNFDFYNLHLEYKSAFSGAFR